MFRRNSFVLAASVLLFATVGWRHGNAPSAPLGRLVIVKMVDVSGTTFKFEPATVTVQKGDTVRFLQVVLQCVPSRRLHLEDRLPRADH